MFSTFVYRGSSHRRKSAVCPKFDLVLAVSLAYPSGEEGGNFLVQMISTDLLSRRVRGAGGRHPVVENQNGRPKNRRTEVL